MSKSLKTGVCAILVLITLFSFRGFPYAAYDVKNTTVIQGVGIDYDEETKKYTLTVEIFDVSQSSGADEVGNGNLTKIITVTGDNVSSAMEKLTLEIGKTLIYSQKRLVVIGKDALMQGVTGVMDFFVRDYKTRSNVLLAAAMESSAAEVISANEGNVSFPARELQELLESGKVNGYTKKVNFATLTELMKDKYTAAYLPVLEVHGSGKDVYAALSGFVVIHDEKPAGVLSLEEVRGFLFLTDSVFGGTLNVDNENLGFSSLKIVKNDTRVSVTADKEPHILVNIDCVMDIMEVRAEKGVVISEDNADEILKSAEKYIKKITDQTLEKCLNDYNCDIFGFGKRMWISNPSYCKSLDNPDENIIDFDSVETKVNVKIRRVGQGSV